MPACAPLFALLAAAAAQEETTRIALTGGQDVKGAAWSPDGSSFAAGAFKRVAAWDSATLQNLMNASDNADVVNAVAYSHDGAMLLSSGGRTLFGWDARSGQRIRSFEGHTDYTYAVAFGRDDLLVSAGDRRAIVWNASTGEELFNTTNCPSLCDRPPSMYSVALAADTGLFASGAYDGSVMIRAVADGTLKHKLFEHTRMVMSLAFSPDGAALASAAFDGSVRVVNVSSGEPLQVLQVGGTLWSLAYSADGKRLAAGGSDGIVRIWDTASWALTSSLDAKVGETKAVTFSPRGDRLLVAQSNSVFLWNLNVSEAVWV